MAGYACGVLGVSPGPTKKRAHDSLHVDLDTGAPSLLALTLGFRIDVDHFEPYARDHFCPFSNHHSRAAARLRGIAVRNLDGARGEG